MKVLSLFDGISCARVALERAGIPVDLYYASEIDKNAIAVAQKNYPDTKQLGDVTQIDGCYIGIVSKGIDLLIGGSPCQDLSIAKKNRKGLDGERSGLFWEYVRILNEVKPKYFILENVNSMPKEAKEIITKTLGVEPIMINAALVSAQNRKRLFWVGKLVGNKYEQVQIPQPEDRGILLKHIIENGYTPDKKSLSITASYAKKNEQNYFNKSDGQMIAPNDIIYQYRRTYWRETKGGKVPTLTANMGTGGNNVPYVFDIYNDKIVPNNKAKTLGTNPQCRTAVAGQLVIDKNLIRKLTPIECERLQGLPDNYTEGVSNTQRYKALGNAFNVDVVAHIIRFLKQ